MKKPAFHFRNSCAALLLSGLLAAASPTGAQPTLYGPQNPPPKESSIEFTGTESDGEIGRSGGKVYTISNITLSNSTTVYWTMIENAIKLSMDGSNYSAEEVLTLNTGLTNLAEGVITWNGTSSIRWRDTDSEVWRTTPLFSKFIVTVTHADNTPFALVAPATTGLNAGTGGSVFITGSSMVFKVRMQMLVAESLEGTYYPHLDYYDAKHTDGVLAYSTYNYGFYWENDPPQLKTNAGATVDEGDTVAINHTKLAATDVESNDDETFVIIDLLGEGLLPAHGALIVDEVPVVATHTLTMTDIMTKTIQYVHDDSETVLDSIAFSIHDSDSAMCYVNGDSVFYFILTITPVDDPPVAEVNTGATIDEGASLTLTSEHLLATDPESSADKVKYTLDPEGNSEFPKNGLLKLNGVPLGDGGTFTQADINTGKVIYTHNGSETLSDGFVFEVADEFGHLASTNGSTIFFFDLTINPVNDDPVLTKNLPLEILEGGSGIIRNALITATDAESPPADIKFTLDPKENVSSPMYGEVRLNGTLLNDTEGFTMADVNNNLVTYVHDGSENHSDLFVFNVTDPHGGMARDGAYTEFQFRIYMTNVNDPPVVANPIADQQTRAGEPYSFIFPENTFEDVDAEDVLSYTSFTNGEEALPTWLSFNGASREYSGTPAVADKGVLTVILQATDSKLAEARDTFDIEVFSNDPPVVVNPIADQETRAGETYSFIFPENTFEDPDAGDVLTYTSFICGGEALPAWLSFNAASREYSGTPAVADKGVLTVILQATDSKLAEARDTFDIEVISPVTAGDHLAGELISIAPVPFSDRLIIQINTAQAAPARITIFNMLGEKINFYPETGTHKLEIDMRSYASGIYFVRAEIDNKTILKKVLKQ
jgi:hypothetical protein